MKESKPEPRQVSSCCRAPAIVKIEDVKGDDGSVRRRPEIKCAKCGEKCDAIWE